MDDGNEGGSIGARPAEPDVEIVPFNSVRRRTAAHMVASKSISAHTFCAIEVDYAHVESARSLRRFTYLPFVTSAVASALRIFPHVNASVVEDSLHVHRAINLGIAVNTGNGLVVPVVHNADTLHVAAIAERIADLATRARAKKLTLDDMAGGTFTITNPGPFGSLVSAPIINQPQVAILSTDAVARRPAVLDAGGPGEVVSVRPIGNLSLSFDHRAFDGAYATAFLRQVKLLLEDADWVARALRAPSGQRSPGHQVMPPPGTSDVQ